MVVELQLFNQDCEEQIKIMQETLDELKMGHDNTQLINQLFRTIHTIKGGASMFEFDEIIHFAHLLEDFVEPLRDNEIKIDRKIITLLLDCKEHLITLISDSTENRQSETTQKQTDKLIKELCFLREDSKSALLQSIEKNVQIIAEKLSKKIDFTISIKNQNFNQEIIKNIYNPLIHMIRNAIDHGIENQGKIEFIINCDKENHILILKDNGRGINKEKIIEKAIDKKIIKKDQKLNKKEVFDLIFEAGVSTAKEKSTISGRGVGMDIVKEKLQSYNATIEIESQKNIGTTFIMKFPKYLPLKYLHQNILNPNIPFREFEKY